MKSNGCVMGTPDFARSVERVDLLRACLADQRRIIVLCAPSGYGKTVLAAQIAANSTFCGSVWIELSESLVSSSTLLESMSARLRPQLSGSSAKLPAERPTSPQDLAIEIAAELVQRSAGLPICVVLDDMRFDDDGARVNELDLLLKALLQSSVTMVLTTRELAESQIDSLVMPAEIIDADDLRLSADEAVALGEEMAAGDIDPEQLETLWGDCGGHAATLSLLIRHGILRGFDRDRVWSSTGLRSLVRRSIAELSSQLRDTLVSMALLGAGSDAELRQALDGADRDQARRLCQALPLVQVIENRQALGFLFRVHDSVQEEVLSFASQEQAQSARAALEVRGDLERAAWLLQRFGSEGERCSWILAYGEELLLRGLHAVLTGLLDRIPVGIMLDSPRLMLLSAKALNEAGQQEPAHAKAAVARSLADHSGDHVVASEATLLQALLQGDMGRMDLREQLLREFIDHYRALAPAETLAWAYSALAGTLTTCNALEAIVCQEEAVRVSRRCVVSSRLKAKLLANGAAVDALARGDWRSATQQTLELAELAGVMASDRAKALGNAAVGLCETGRLERSLEVVEQAIHMAAETGNEVFRGSYLPVKGAATLALGDADAGIRLMEAGIRLSQEAGDRYGAEYSRIYVATGLRSELRGTESLGSAEQSFEFFSSVGSEVMRALAQTELAASLLAVGEMGSASRMIDAVPASSSPYHLLRADMILAEIARREGRVEDGVALISAHEEYILTESSNWQIAMYCRAFPELLGVFALAIEPDRLPVHMLRMILPDNAERSLIGSRGWVDDVTWRQLGVRLLGEEEFESFIERDGRPLCRVRLFGGLEVTVGGRAVTEREWKKRKARLLFAMLVARRGQEVPRDQVLEYLWPEMDETRARNNLYVVWSAMKGALLGDTDKSAHLPYIENSRGMCRINVEAVRSDVDEFERRLADAAAANESGDQVAALAAYRELGELYRGELLPGDIYDDWFSEQRERYKTEFVAAMRKAAEICADRKELGAALHYVRRAVQADPWQEDLYQLALRCQIAAGQRGAAIETYMQCRTKLSEDLGLDPSAETRALYDQILAMEDRPMPIDYFEALD